MNDARVFIRPPCPEDRAAFLVASRASRDLHQPWISPPLTDEEFDLYLNRFDSAEHESRLVCLVTDGAISGVINLNNIIRGYFQNAFLGYYAFEGHASRGLMLEGLRLVIREAFEELGLHRLEANIQPENERSIRLVERAGFLKEGFSPRYLRIDGQWRDHERWALVRSSP